MADKMKPIAVEVYERISTSDMAKHREAVVLLNDLFLEQITQVRNAIDGRGVPLWVMCPEPQYSWVSIYAENRTQICTNRRELDVDDAVMAARQGDHSTFWQDHLRTLAMEMTSHMAVTTQFTGVNDRKVLISNTPQFYMQRQAYKIEIYAYTDYCLWKHIPVPLGKVPIEPTPDPAADDVAPEDKPQLVGLFRDNPETPEGKYLVQRRDGSVVPWPSFVLGARDRHAEVALRAYADSIATDPDCHPTMAQRLRDWADEFARYREEVGQGDPTRGAHRKDDPATIAKMKLGRSA